jgi:hypothetical protein
VCEQAGDAAAKEETPLDLVKRVMATDGASKAKVRFPLPSFLTSTYHCHVNTIVEQSRRIEVMGNAKRSSCAYGCVAH